MFSSNSNTAEGAPGARRPAGTGAGEGAGAGAGAGACAV